MSSGTDWTTHRGTSGGGAVTLYCFPFAGGGASTYEGWPARLSPYVDVRPVALPGREGRRLEVAHTSMDALVAAALDGLVRELEPPFAFFGHSMGGVLAFELARELRRREGVTPEWLFVSGSPAPHLPMRRAPLHHRDDEALVDHLRGLDGTPLALFDHRWVLDLYLPVFRADLTAFETRTWREGEPLDCPITGFYGEADAFVPAEDVQAWRHHTVGPCVTHGLAGGHFFLRDREAEVLAAVGQALAGLSARL